MRMLSLCTGVGGLDLAVEAVVGAQLAYVAEVDEHASTVIAARFPGVPNLGDFTTVDWSTLGDIDVLTAGYPCQPFSHAGRRKGTDDDRHLWPFIADAIRVLRPRLVVLENVRGHLSLGFGDVLGDLAELRYDTEWILLRASDVGISGDDEDARPAVAEADVGCGGRGAWTGLRTHEPRGIGRRRPSDADSPAAADADRLEQPEHACEPRRQEGASRRGSGDHRPAGDGAASGGHRRVVEPAAADTVRVGHEPLEVERREPARGRAATGLADGDRAAGVAWGAYADAIERHERVLGRPAPDPLVGRQISGRFVEWMMALPDGWITDLVPNRHALRLCGNAVVPLQAATALRILLDRHEQDMTC